MASGTRHLGSTADSLNHEPTDSTLRGGGANEWPSGSDAHPFRSWDLSSGPCKLPTAMVRKLQATLDIFGLEHREDWMKKASSGGFLQHLAVAGTSNSNRGVALYQVVNKNLAPSVILPSKSKFWSIVGSIHFSGPFLILS